MPRHHYFALTLIQISLDAAYFIENGVFVNDLLTQFQINLDELGFDDFMTSLRENYVQLIAQKLFLDWGGGKLDSHKAFTVKYKVGDDLDLSYHYDNAEVTLNVAISPGSSFSGGALYFGDIRNKRFENKNYTVYQHQTGVGILHRGQHMHGAQPIESGERINLIIWMRASSVRNQLCPMCDRKPDLVETQGKGDGFAVEVKTVDVCQLT